MRNRSKSSSGRAADKAPGQRQLRVGERLRHILADILRRGELRDPILAKAHLITVTAVDIGPDLQHANAYVMPLGGDNADEIVKALNKAAGYFRSEMAAELDLRYTPKVSFRIDKSFDEADHISRLLRQDAVRKDVEKPDTLDNVEDDDDGDQDL
jgi:ribosome-binding factor A